MQKVMTVNVIENPKHPGGLGLQFPYHDDHVRYIKNILGVTFDRPNKLWSSEGPEILLDMQRFGIEINWLSREAREICEGFRQQLWDVMDARYEDIEEDYAYQKQGTRILSSMPFMILGDDMGLGKSKQSLDAAVAIGAKRILILCPKTLCYNWAAEVDRWHPEMTHGVVPDFTSDKREAEKGKSSRTAPIKELGFTNFWLEQNRPQIVIANYEKARMNAWPMSLKWDVVILDEATKLKNHNTFIYKTVKRLLRRAEVAWALTGTPLEIRVIELYNILGLLRPAVLGGYMRFFEQHVVQDSVGTVIGIKNIDLLRERISPFMLRRTKQEVLKQLPPKIYNNVYVKMTPIENNAYNMMKVEFNNWLEEHNVSGKGNPLTEMLRMRQFCCTPDLFTDELGKGSKFEMLQELVGGWSGKIVIFCFFEQVIQRLMGWLNVHPQAFISGTVSDSKERIRRVDAFNKGELGKVFLSTDAGGMGLNITGADMIIHYDQLFNPQRMHQREDRLHRIGQLNRVTVVNMLTLDSIDVGMYQLNKEREHLFEEVIDGAEELILRKLSAPRLRRIIEGRLTEEAKSSEETLEMERQIDEELNREYGT